MDCEYLPIKLHNFDFLNIDDFIGFNEDVYKYISIMNPRKYHKYMNIKYNNISNDCHEITYYEYKFNNESQVIELCNDVYEGEFQSYIILHQDGINMNIINLNKLLNNILISKGRYYPLFNIIKYLSNLNTAHATLFIFDKYNKIVYLIDSNGRITYSNKYKDKELFKIHFYNFLQNIFSKIDYTVILPSECGINTKLNTNDKVYNFQYFGKGYCTAYSILYAELFLLSDDKKNVDDIIKLLTDLNNVDKNELINRYQYYLYLQMKSGSYL